MGISDFIQRKKELFFVARDSDKLELQKANLMKQAAASRAEREKVDEIRKLQAEIRGNQNTIHEGRTAGSRAVVQKIATGFKSFGQGVKQFGDNQRGGNSDSPFYTGGVSGKKAIPPKTEGKTVVIKIGK